jgi:hypothetical protein
VIVLTLVFIAGLMIGLYFTWPLIKHTLSSITVTGTLEAGVEAGCVILRADDGTQYLLLGRSDYPPVGSRVTVTGYENNVVSYCMQGKAAVHVTSISICGFTTSKSNGCDTAAAISVTEILATRS